MATYFFKLSWWTRIRERFNPRAKGMRETALRAEILRLVRDPREPFFIEPFDVPQTGTGDRGRDLSSLGLDYTARRWWEL